MSIQVTATDTETGDTMTQEVDNDYVLVCAGSAKLTSRQVYVNKDGTITTVLTVRGARPRRG